MLGSPNRRMTGKKEKISRAIRWKVDKEERGQREIFEIQIEFRVFPRIKRIEAIRKRRKKTQTDPRLLPRNGSSTWFRDIGGTFFWSTKDRSGKLLSGDSLTGRKARGITRWILCLP